MIVLGIETTCDETAAAVIERLDDGQDADKQAGIEAGQADAKAGANRVIRGRIRSNVVLSQISEHAEFGGVVPEIAARAHVEALDRIIAKAMADAKVSFRKLDGIAAAAGPGLIGGVIVGLTTAKAIALAHDKPLIAVNHLEAHALTARLTDGVDFPYCLFLASGGHTQILAVRGVGDYVRLGGTVDDAIGEAFDKTAKLLGLGYPGGPLVEKEAERGDPARFLLPRPMSGRRDADFSLSGLKTALRIEAEKIAPLSDQDVADLCASFQQAVVDVVKDRLRAGLRMFRLKVGAPNALVCAGGVAANQAIRKVLQRVAFEVGTELVAPPPALCTDNGAMIAWAGAERLALGLTDPLSVAPRARWPLEQVAGDVKPATPARDVF
ncbi:MAG TPA: tRNA (adenosine(37)-N6)-threonylcarbamoyltransferase complex transferase subunit TsaD [Xanthobacteraceae bacterium]|jgi:N6-L-threonylcarbamoyladenine synthase|nr:tRNA (adenosine(37)-N6)-threonylcarbamoyltransferase complex transferase subunit TsaD [Xanthobacteraceae bacterium]